MTSLVERFRKLNKELCNEPPYYSTYYQTNVKGTERANHRTAAQRKAHDAVKYAVRVGKIVKPKACQVCGHERGLIAHHWRGYDCALDVWWICHPCNHRLPEHDGSVTLEQAKTRMRLWYE